MGRGHSVELAIQSTKPLILDDLAGSLSNHRLRFLNDAFYDAGYNQFQQGLA